MNGLQREAWTISSPGCCAGAAGVWLRDDRPVTLANLDLSANTPDERMRVFGRMERDFGLANAFLLAVGAWLLVSRDFSTLMLIFCLIYILVVCISALLYLKNLRSGEHSST